MFFHGDQYLIILSSHKMALLIFAVLLHAIMIVTESSIFMNNLYGRLELNRSGMYTSSQFNQKVEFKSQ